MSRTRRAGLAAYRALIEAIPAAAVDVFDNPMTAAKGRRADKAFGREASHWAVQIRVPSKWYATDGSGAFYFFRRKRTDVDLVGDIGLARLPITVNGVPASRAYYRHGGQLTDRKPAGWLSIATISAVNYGGLEGGPRDWGWKDNEDSDLDISVVERLRAQNPDPYITGSLHAYAERVQRAMAGAR